MERTRVLAVIVLFLVVARVSDASCRVLMADGKGDDKLKPEKVSPSPTPNPSPKNSASELSQKPPQKKSPEPPPPAANSTTKSLKIPPPSGNTINLVPPGRPENNKNGENSQRRENPTKSRSPTDRSQENACHASAEKCHTDEFVACIQHLGDDSKELFVLVQNTGESMLTVKIKVMPAINIIENIQIAKGNKEKIPVNAASRLEIVLNAGKQNCILHTKTSFSDWNPFRQFPSYATHLTTIYGAYILLFVTMVIAGGTWACCKFRRGRRADTGIPYQQLEMGAQTQPSLSVDSNTADGWDEGWDEEWDEEEAVPQASEKHPPGSVSANGLTSRSPRKDGWDVDWDE